MVVVVVISVVHMVGVTARDRIRHCLQVQGTTLVSMTLKTDSSTVGRGTVDVRG